MAVLHFLMGLSFFLFGMYLLSRSLEEIAGGRLEKILKRATARPLRGLALGTVVTMAVQSSSAVTVMLVSLAEAGLIVVAQAVAVIFGANIGTTITAWLLSLSGLEGDAIWIQMLKPEHFAPILASVGIFLIYGGKTARRHKAGEALLGFAVLMNGMELMKDAVAPLAENEAFSSLLIRFEHPILGVLAGAAVTAVIQSSSASVGILQALALSGSVSRSLAVPLIMGQNIGTCITALISSVGGGKAAKQVAYIHLLINTVGTAVCLLVYWVGGLLFPLPDAPIGAVGIALTHTLFNVLITALLFPFAKQIERVSARLVHRST